MLLETAVQFESDPPVTKMSASLKLVDASESVKVSVAISPALSDAVLDVRAMFGLMVSIVSVSELLASLAS